MEGKRCGVLPTYIVNGIRIIIFPVGNYVGHRGGLPATIRISKGANRGVGVEDKESSYIPNTYPLHSR